MNSKNIEFKYLISKLKLQQKSLEEYSDDYLEKLESEVYNNKPEQDKINYELINVKLNNNPDINQKIMYQIILNKTIELLKEQENNIMLIKQLISTIQIILGEEYAFFTSVKHFDENFYNYLDNITNSELEKIKMYKKEK